MLTLALVYVAGLGVTGVAVTALARRHGDVGRRYTLVLASCWPLLVVGLLVSGAVFAPIELAARRRRRRGDSPEG